MSAMRLEGNYSSDNERKSSQTPTTSPLGLRITIELKGSGAKKGPLSIKSSVDPKDVVIQRRFGEGSKPLFSRDDIRVNRKPESSKTPPRKEQKESTSSDSRVEETRRNVNRHCEIAHSPKTPERIPYFADPRREADRLRAERRHSSVGETRKNINRHRRKSHSPEGPKTPEKIPYFTDTKREEERLRAKYSHSHRPHRTRSKSRSRRRSRFRSRSPRRSRRRSRSRSRPRYRSRSRSRSRSRHRSYDRNRRSLSRSKRRDRSSSRNRSRRRSPYPEQRFIPVSIPMEYPCPAGWMAPPMPPYPRNPFMLRPPIPFYSLRPPFLPMDYPIRPPRLPGRQPRPYRPGPSK